MITITQNVTHTITKDLLEDLLVTAFEGGSNYWLDQILCSGYIYDLDNPEWTITIVDCDDGQTVLTHSTLKKGIQKTADEYPRVFKNIVEENYDAGDADVWLQLCVFGECVYG